MYYTINILTNNGKLWFTQEATSEENALFQGEQYVKRLVHNDPNKWNHIKDKPLEAEITRKPNQ